MNQILNLKKLKKDIKKTVKYYKLIFIGINCLIIIVSLFYINNKLEYKNNMIYSNSINSFGKVKQIYNNIGKKYNKYFGRIIIRKINLDCMILDNFTNENLEISICKLNGENIDGNVSLIGHNFENDMFFSNIDKLGINDKIVVYINNIEYEYIVYKKYEVFEDDLSPLQDNGFSEITLITCNNLNKKRIIIKAKNK